MSFRLRGYHTLWPVFPDRSANSRIGNSTYAALQPLALHARLGSHSTLLCRVQFAGMNPYKPTAPTPCRGYPNVPCSARFRLFRFRSPLLSESRLLSLPPGTEMVHFPGFASSAYGFSGGFSGFTGEGFPIRRSPDQCLLAAPRGLSQLATSFIACLRQGIHRTPLVA